MRALLRDHARAIAEDYPRHWRQSGGYRLDRLDPFDLSKLIVGSEGTLAVVTAATVRLVELPKAKMFAVGHFDDLLAAIAATDDALALEPSAVELIDRTILDLSRSKLEYRKLADRLEGDPEALLFVSLLRRHATPRCATSSTRWSALGASTATATTRCAPRPPPSRPR